MSTTTEQPEALESRDRFAATIIDKENSRLYDTVVHANGSVRYVTVRNGVVETLESVEVDGMTYRPPQSLESFVRTESIFLPSGVWSKPASAEELLGEIQAFIRRYALLPEEWVLPIAVWILHTWVFERFETVSYLRFIGEAGHGKGRLMKIAAYLSNRCVMTNGALTGAALFRTIDLVRGTFAIDEGDFKQSNEKNEVIKILNVGYEQGAAVFRCHGDDYNPTAYACFGPKIIVTRKRFGDDATETRCFTFQTQRLELPDHISLQRPQAFGLEAQQLRNQLLRWRLDNFFKISADEREVRRLASNRLAQMSASLFGVVPVGPMREELLRFVRSYDAQTDAESDVTLIKTELTRFASKNERFAVKAVVDMLNSQAEGDPESHFTSQGVASIARSEGYKVTRAGVGMVVHGKKQQVDV